MHLLLLAATLLLVLPGHARAQRLEPGARVRIRPPCEGPVCYAPIIGEFRSLSGDTLVILESDGRTYEHLLSPATRFDLSHGYRSRVAEGLGLGLAAGIVAGFIAKKTCEGPRNTGDNMCGLYYLVTVPPGILVGGIVGAHFKVEWWLPAPRTTVGLVQVPGGTGVALRVEF